MKRLIAISSVVALVLVAFVAAGCGGGGGTDDAATVIKDTFSRDINSGKVKLNLTANLQGLAQAAGPVSVKLDGPFDGLKQKIKDTGKLPKANLALAVSGGGQSFQGGFTSTGSKAFVAVQGQDYVLGQADFNRLKAQLQKAQERGAKSGQKDLSTLGVRPQDWLKNPSNVGTEEIAGTETNHVSAGLNVTKMLDDVDLLLKKLKSTPQAGLSAQQQRQLPSSIPPNVKKQIVQSVKEAKFDVFSGKDDKVLRKVQIHVRFEIPKGLRTQLQGLRGGNVNFTLQLADVNKPQTVAEPKQVKPFSELKRTFGTGNLGLGGGTAAPPSGGSSQGASGSTGSTGGNGSSSSSPADKVDPKLARRYLKCVQGAKSQSELQTCAGLLK